jgi:hypothetical protein
VYILGLFRKPGRGGGRGQRDRNLPLRRAGLALRRHRLPAAQRGGLADHPGHALLPAQPLRLLRHVPARQRFPGLERITVYGSAKFLVKKSEEEWRRVAEAGITRIHSGLESGDAVTLEQIGKGVTPEQAIEAYRHVKASGIQFSVYLMVGVAGVERWREHALGSAHVLNRAPPDFVRLRTFVPAPGTPWHERWAQGRLTLLSAHQALEETRLLVESIEGPTSLLSDHISNFIDVRGRIPEDKPAMLAQIDEALGWPPTSFRPPTERLVGLQL